MSKLESYRGSVEDGFTEQWFTEAAALVSYVDDIAVER